MFVTLISVEELYLRVVLSILFKQNQDPFCHLITIYAALFYYVYNYTQLFSNFTFIFNSFLIFYWAFALGSQEITFRLAASVIDSDESVRVNPMQGAAASEGLPKSTESFHSGRSRRGNRLWYFK